MGKKRDKESSCGDRKIERDEREKDSPIFRFSVGDGFIKAILPISKISH